MATSDALVHASRQLLSTGAETTAKFEWIVVMGGFFAFMAAFGIGKSPPRHRAALVALSRTHAKLPTAKARY